MSIFLLDEETVEIIDSEKYDMVVYLTTNPITKKQYIGQSIYNRPNYLGSGHYILNSLNKYGKENFKKEILKHCKSLDMLNYWEMYYIIEYDTIFPFGYNLDWGGRGSGRISEETRKKISGENNPMYGRKGELHPLYGKYLSDESKRKISDRMKGKHRSKETKKKISENNARYWKGKHRSKETKQKMSIKQSGENGHMYGKYHSKESKRKMSIRRKEYWRKRKELEQTKIKKFKTKQFNLENFI